VIDFIDSDETLRFMYEWIGIWSSKLEMKKRIGNEYSIYYEVPSIIQL